MSTRAQRRAAAANRAVRALRFRAVRRDVEKRRGAIGTAIIDARTSTLGMSPEHVVSFVDQWLMGGGVARYGPSRLVLMAMPGACGERPAELATEPFFERAIVVFVHRLEDVIARWHREGAELAALELASSSGRVVAIVYAGHPQGGVRLFERFETAPGGDA
jgi:hypothetical protein